MFYLISLNESNVSLVLICFVVEEYVKSNVICIGCMPSYGAPRKIIII